MYEAYHNVKNAFIALTASNELALQAMRLFLRL